MSRLRKVFALRMPGGTLRGQSQAVFQMERQPWEQQSKGVQQIQAGSINGFLVGSRVGEENPSHKKYGASVRNKGMAQSSVVQDARRTSVSAAL